MSLVHTFWSVSEMAMLAFVKKQDASACDGLHHLYLDQPKLWLPFCHRVVRRMTIYGSVHPREPTTLTESQTRALDLMPSKPNASNRAASTEVSCF